MVGGTLPWKEYLRIRKKKTEEQWAHALQFLYIKKVAGQNINIIKIQGFLKIG